MSSTVVKTGVAKQSGIHSLPARASGVENFLLKLADPINTTLDLDTLLHTVAELVRQVIPFEISPILLGNERAQDMRLRFQIGHAPEVERLRIKVGRGITGRA